MSRAHFRPSLSSPPSRRFFVGPANMSAHQSTHMERLRGGYGRDGGGEGTAGEGGRTTALFCALPPPMKGLPDVLLCKAQQYHTHLLLLPQGCVADAQNLLLMCPEI